MTHRDAYLHFCCVWPKRWQLLHCGRPFRATYDSNDTRKTQLSLSDLTFDTSGPRTTDTMKSGLGRAVFGGVPIATAEMQLRDSLNMGVQ